MPNSDKIVIGMTGPFGSGCSYIAKNILSKMGYEYVSLSQILKDEVSGGNCSRNELQDKGNELRKQNGASYLAEKAIEVIDGIDADKIVVDSIRNTHEIEKLQNAYHKFYLIATWADESTRWNRVKNKYSNNNSLFMEDDKRDKDEKDENGQQITLCYQMADIIILNGKHIHSESSEDFENLSKIVKRYTDLIEEECKYEPTEMETLMSMAYANSMRSSCSQRKVGALIIDDYGNVFSSGYNEVPTSERPCRSVYGQCYRKYLREDLKNKLNSELDDEGLANKVSNIVKSNSKMLDYCRALHAEENAIVNMARLSVSANLNKSTLYTTTYPCNLCANKIAQVGIKQIVYFEPYPQKEAKETLAAHNVKQIPFEGITFNSYFKFMEVLR